MPTKLLAALLMIIALFAFIDLSRAAKTQLLAAADAVTASARTKATGSAEMRPAGAPAVAGVIRASWRAGDR